MSALETHRRETSYCATCPKLCRFSCPVANVETRETVTPWGKMTVAYEHLAGARPMDVSAAAATYACTGCMRCRTHCRHGNEVGLSLFAARGEAVRSGVAPPEAAQLRSRYRQESPLGVELNTRLPEAPALRRRGLQVFPGCSAITHGSEVVTDALFVLRELGMETEVHPSAGLCCGYPLLAAGLETEFVESAKQLRVATKGLEKLCIIDPGCAWTLQTAYDRFGVPVRFEVTPWVTEVSVAIANARPRLKLKTTASYHDPCYLGRGLGVYQPPRQLLARVLEAPAGEAVEHEDDAGCCGGGGLLPSTRPETAQAMAKDLAAELGAPNRTLVTACPTASRMFGKAGAKTENLVNLIARWLRQPA